MLYLLFQIGNDRYALEARHVVEVVPFLELKRIPHAPRGVAGMFNFRGQPVPAVDLSELTFGRPARELFSTRIIVVKLPPPTRPASPVQSPAAALRDSGLGTPPSGQPACLGLIAEHATGMMRREARDFVASGVKISNAPYLGPVVMDDQGVIQLLHTEHLLSETLRDLLFSETAPADAAAPRRYAAADPA